MDPKSPSKTQDSTIQSPHDRFFKEMFSRKELAANLFRTYLPPTVVHKMKWESLRMEPTSFIDESLTETASDLLYSVKAHGTSMLLYCLFEHQSSIDHDMPLRLLSYMTQIWKRWRKANPKTPGIPAILPLVLYQGKQRWTVSRQFSDHVAALEQFSDLRDTQPTFQHLLIDLSRIPLEEFKGEALLHLVLTLLKAVGENRIEEWMEHSLPYLTELTRESGRGETLRTLLRYLFHAQAIRGPEQSTFGPLLARISDTRVKGKIMTIAEQLKQEGRQEGLKEGKQAGIQQGTMIGKIQHCQQLLNLPVSKVSELETIELTELERLLASLDAQLTDPPA